MQPRFRLKRTLLLAGAAIGLIVLLVLAFLFSPAYSPPAQTLTFVKDAVARQQKIEEGLRAYYQAGKYTFSAPLVIQDPYQTAPLTALVIFDTPENSQISIHVPGKTPQAAVDVTFPGYQQHHEIPIYGLYAGTLNHVTLSMKMQNGESEQTGIELQTEPLPVNIQNATVDTVDRSKYSPGFNFSLGANQKPVFDIDGNVRWYSTEVSFQVFTPLKNGRYLFTYKVGDAKYATIIMEQDLLGKIYAIYNVGDDIHHDIYELPNGNMLVTSSFLETGTQEDVILEVDRNSGHIVRSFDLKDILDPNRLPMMGFGPVDWLHLNSIFYDPTDQSIIISSRAQSAVIKLTYPGMQIKWILGAHDNWSAKYQPYLLTPVGTGFEWPWEQHDATLYSPDVPGDNIVDILLFDNGQYRSFDPASAQSPLEWYSRVVHYRINEAAMTIEQVWEYGKTRGAAISNSNGGSAYHLPNGDILGNWGGIGKDAQGIPVREIDVNDTRESKIIEVDPVTNEVVFEYGMPNTIMYRTLRAGFYDGYSDENTYLSAAMNDTTENDPADRSFLAWRDVKQWSYSNPAILAIRRAGRQILAAIKVR